jgi:ribonuclease HII
MDVFTHTIIATGSLLGAYLVGRHLTVKNLSEGMIDWVLENLENEGFVATKKLADGDVELIPISEIIAKTIRDENIK